MQIWFFPAKAGAFGARRYRRVILIALGIIFGLDVHTTLALASKVGVLAPCGGSEPYAPLCGNLVIIHDHMHVRACFTHLDDDVDPLDAFMATNQRKGQEELAKKAAAPKAADRFADEEDDPETAYYIALEKKKAQMAAQALQGKSAADLAAELAMSGGHLGGGADVDSDEEVYGTAKAIRDAEKAANVVPSLKTAMEELSGVVIDNNCHR